MKAVYIFLLATLAIYVLFIGTILILGKKSMAQAIVRFLPDCIILFKNLLKDKRVRRKHKLAIVLLIGYLAIPIDIVPDFIPIAGQLDDAIIVAIVLRYIFKGVETQLLKDKWLGPQSSLKLLMKLARLK